MNQDPLIDLLVDSEEIDRARLAGVLRDILGVDAESGQLMLRPGFNHLNARNKVLAFILGKKAAMLLGKSNSEDIAAKDITLKTGIPSGTVNPKLKELRELRLVSQTKSSKYFVAPHQIMKAVEELEKGL